MAGGRTRLPTWLTTTRRSTRSMFHPGYCSCGTGTHTVSSKPQDGIMERLIDQDPMIIAASRSGVMHTAHTAQVAGERRARRFGQGTR
jgi:hypothetical protein